MDEAKRKELEELRKQIDPEVLKRVADAMGASGGDAAPAAPAEPQQKQAKKPAAPARRGGLKDLKARIARREKELDSEETPASNERVAVFLAFDPSHLRAKQLMAFTRKWGFQDVQAVSDGQYLIKTMIELLNDANVQRLSIVVFSEVYAGVRALLEADKMRAIGSKLPKFNEMQLFAVFDENSQPTPLEGLESKNVLTLRHSEEFNSKRVRHALALPEES